MFIFKNNFKCFKLHVCIKYAKIINLPPIFKFSSENNNEQIKPKIVPKIIQKIRKEDINNKANDIRKRDDSKQRKEKKPVVPKEDKNGEQKPNKEKAKDKENKPKPSIKKTEPMRTDVRGDVQPYFLNKSKEEDLDPKSFSVAKLMEYNSLERRNKIKHIETTLILNKDLTKEMPKSEIKKKLSITKEELVRELPKHL